MDATTLRGNPELFRNILRNVVEEIVSETSNEQGEPIAALQNEDETPEVKLKRTINELINNMWSDSDIFKKSTHLHQLELQAPPDLVAWRPTTGEVPYLDIKGGFLTGLKLRLMHNLQKCESKKQELEGQLLVKAKALEVSPKKITEGEEHISHLVTGNSNKEHGQTSKND